MFEIRCRVTEDNRVGRRFQIWEREDGADSVVYLKALVLAEDRGSGLPTTTTREYRMTYRKVRAAP